MDWHKATPLYCQYIVIMCLLWSPIDIKSVVYNATCCPIHTQHVAYNTLLWCIEYSPVNPTLRRYKEHTCWTVHYNVSLTEYKVYPIKDAWGVLLLWFVMIIVFVGFMSLYPHTTKLVERGGRYTGFTFSICLSICPFVCRWHGFQSVTQVTMSLSKWPPGCHNGFF